MTSLEQWENFLEFNIPENAGSSYTFTSDIDFFQIYPTGCPAIDIYLSVDGGGHIWKNFFIIGHTFDFKYGVCNLNFVNMFAKDTSLIKWDKFIENVTMSASITGNINYLFNCSDRYGETRINNCFINIYGYDAYMLIDDRANVKDSSSAKGILSNCVIKFDADISSARFLGANCINVVFLGRLQALSDSSYIQSWLYVDPYNRYEKLDDGTWQLRIPVYSAIYNFYAQNFNTNKLTPSYHGELIYNADLAPFRYLIMATTPETIPEGVTTKVPIAGKYVTGTLKPDDVPPWKWYCVPEEKSSTTSQWSYDVYHTIEEDGVRKWYLQWEHSGYGLDMGGIHPYLSESIANGDCLHVDYGLTLPDWVISTKYGCPMPVNLTVPESISGAFRNTKISSIILPENCEYCENSFPSRCSIIGGTRAKYYPE